MDERALTFVAEHPTAAMISLRRDGTPHAVRVAVGVVDGKVLSSGTQTRARTKHLRRDPRCTLFVFDTQQNWRWLTLETTVTLLEGDDVPAQSLRFFREMQRIASMNPKPGHIVWNGKEIAEAAFLRAMVDEQRLLYEFDIQRAYGMY